MAGIRRTWKGQPVRRPKRKAANGLFLPGYLTEVKMAAMRGLSNREMAGVFGIPYSLFKKWVGHYPSFKDAIEKGRLRADAEVVAALFKRATGKFSIPHTEVIKYKDDYETLQMRKHFPPETDAIKYWLNNRQKENWKQRSHSEMSGVDGKPIEVDTRSKDELIDAIVKLVHPKPDGDSTSPVQAEDELSRAKSRKLKKKTRQLFPD